MIDLNDEDFVLKIVRTYYLEKSRQGYRYIDEIADEGPQLRVSVVSDDWGFDEYVVPKEIFTAEDPIKTAKTLGLIRRINIISQDIKITCNKLGQQKQELLNLSNQLSNES